MARSSAGQIVAVGCVLLALTTGGRLAVAQEQRPPMPVTVVTLQAEDVPLTTTLPGRVVASRVAEVRPQVDGIIVERVFQEGATVKVGDPLYKIDPVSYQAREASARAQVAQAKAQLRSAQKEATRAKELFGRKVASEQFHDDAIAERDSAAANLQAAEADLRTAEINLDRTTIRAPLAGVVGRSLTTEGALVTAGQAQPLAVIRTLNPILVDVTQSAAELVSLRRDDREAQNFGASGEVTLVLADGLEYLFKGQLKLAESHVDEQTGVVTLRLEFPNPKELLLPGMYVQAQMPLGVARDAVLAPQEGVTRDRRGRPVALVANAENIAEQRELTILRSKGSDWVVSEGLKAGDRIIVEGLQKIGPGSPVAPEERAAKAAAAPQSAAAKADQ